MYTINQILGATILGGPLAGFWFIAKNYGEMKRNRAKAISIVAGILSTAALLIVAFQLEEARSPLRLGGISAVVVALIAKALQGREIEAALESGVAKKPHRNWIFGGLGALVLMFVSAFAVIMALAFLAPELLPPEIVEP